MFINMTNHPSEKWSGNQINASEVYGSIVDFPFPQVSANANELELRDTANMLVNSICSLCPTVVLCQGEFTLTFLLVSALKARNIKVVSACSERVVTETVSPDGTTSKTAQFQFVRYREY